MDPETLPHTTKRCDEDEDDCISDPDAGADFSCEKNCHVQFNTWVKLLGTSRQKMDLLNRKLCVNTLLYKEIEETMMEFRRLHRKFGDNLSNEQMVHLAGVLEVCLNRLERVAYNSAEFARSIYYIRKILGILEDRVIGEGEEGPQNNWKDPFRIALECIMKGAEGETLEQEQTSHNSTNNAMEDGDW